MAKKRKTTSANNQTHIHIWDIPAKYFPRGKNAREYGQDISRTTYALDYTNTQVQYAAQICAFNIKSINQKSGFSPEPPDVFNEIEKFVYHYENYCYRLYTYREKLLQFLNAILPIGYREKDVRITHILINPVINQAGILPLIEAFGKNTSLNRVINDRTKLTHRLYYLKEIDYSLRPMGKYSDKPDEYIKWYDDWRREFMSRAKLANDCTAKVSQINNSIAQKIIDYKDQL